MRAVTAVALVAALASLPHSARAALRPRDTAAVGSAGDWSVGVFNPLVYGVADGVELQAHPLVFLGSPNGVLRVGHVQGEGDWRLTGEYGLSVPGIAFNFAMPFGVRGDLVPACKVLEADPDRPDTCQAPGWIVVPRAGLVASTGSGNVTTLRMEAAYGLLLSGGQGRPLDAFPALDLLMAPALNGWRLRAGGRYDHALSDAVRATAQLDLYVVGPTPEPTRSPVTVSVHLGLDMAMGDSSRFTFGVIYYNSDQRETEVVDDAGRAVRRSVRSNDFLPTIDFIWSS